MSSTWGNNLKISIFGESHGNGIGVVIDGLPAGEKIDLDLLSAFTRRRTARSARISTPRQEADQPEFLSGLWEGKTTGTPLAVLIRNTNTRSGDYGELAEKARPGHADFTGFLRYRGANDYRGGGHFSGRLTAPLVCAGGIALQVLARRGITVGGHILKIHGIGDEPFDPVHLTAEQLRELGQKDYAVVSDKAWEHMRAEIERARLDCDSVGGIVECAVVGMPAGIGSPMFDGMENAISSIVFGIPAVRGIEFGAGFAAAGMFGSEHNDPFLMKDGRVVTETNHHGGVLGGITSGMPIVFRVAFKPTASIAKEQRTINLKTGEETTLSVQGRHDPCIVPRAVPCVEAATAIAILDRLLGEGQ